MKVNACITTLMVGTLWGAAVFAQDKDMIPQPAPAPASVEIIGALKHSPEATQFARIFATSGLSLTDFSSKYVTLLVPQDSACIGRDRVHLEAVTTREDARSYVQSHAFLGALSNLYGRPVTAYASPAGASDAHPQSVAIDDAHPFEAPLARGGSVQITSHEGVIKIGGQSAVMSTVNGSDGGIIYLDNCAVL